MTARVLILGGTGEARRLAGLLADRVDVISSLAGRTADPAPLPGQIRRGGFGGAEGLARYLVEKRIDVLIDATHPYAARMGFNAAEAARRTDLPILRVDRPSWIACPGDDWRMFETLDALGTALPRLGTHALITLGGADLESVVAIRGIAMTVRAIDPPKAVLERPDIAVILERGPFDLDGELALLSARGIDVLVSRDSGGRATAAKLIAARTLGLPVAMLSRPARPLAETVKTVDTVEGAVRWVLSAVKSREDLGNDQR